MKLSEILTRNWHLKNKRGAGAPPRTPHLLRHCQIHFLRQAHCSAYLRGKQTPGEPRKFRFRKPEISLSKQNLFLGYANDVNKSINFSERNFSTTPRRLTWRGTCRMRRASSCGTRSTGGVATSGQCWRAPKSTPTLRLVWRQPLRFYITTFESLPGNEILLFQVILFEIGFIEEMQITWGNKKDASNLFPQFLLFVKIRFNPYDSVPLAILHFVILWHYKRLILQNFMQTLGYYSSPKTTPIWFTSPILANSSKS